MANAAKIIHKGLSDKKDYLLHTLQNGMKCLLISQPENEEMPESMLNYDYDDDDDDDDDDLKNDDLKNDDLKNDDLENDDLKNDDLKNDDLENDDLENDDLENDDLKNDDLKNDDLKNEDLKNDDLKNDDLKNDDLKNNEEMTDRSFNSCSEKEELITKGNMFAMAISVNVGSFDDPIEAQGLAHLLEHMILMGSEKYPEDNYFDKFLNKKSGHSNAETGCEYTIFHFEVPAEYFQEAIDIFASMFEAPKLAKESIEKEKQVVDSEFQMAITDDEVRLQRLLSLNASMNCPARKFVWGSLKSLDLENLDKMVLDFWKTHYSASRMFLTVQSQHSTHELLELIDGLFSKIPTDHLPKLRQPDQNLPFKLVDFHKIHKVISVSCINKLTFSWFLPSVLNLYKYKPLEYISWIVGHEGKGSLISYLRQLNYAMELDAGIEDDFYSNNIYSLFAITIELTDLGLENVDMVIELTFSYLALIRQQGISEDIFKQIQTLSKNDFNLSENKNASDHVIELSLNMMNFAEEDYLCGPVLFFEYEPKLIESILEMMTVNRVAIFIFSTNFDQSHLTLTDEIFGTKYSCDNFKEELENKWSKVTPHPFFKIPSKNQYLSTDFSILPESADIKYPQKIFENEHIELWHKQDNCFKLPKGYIMLNFITQMPSKSMENNVNLDLFLDTIIFLLNEDTYPTLMAQLNYNIQVFIHGFELTFVGFNEKLPLLVDMVLNCINNFKNLITEDIFNMVKYQAINKLKNKQYDLDFVASDIKNCLIKDPEWFSGSKLCYLENIEYSELLTFYEQLSNLYCQALIQGNISQNQAIEISKKVVSTLNYQPLDKKCFPVILVKRLNQGDCRVRLSNYNRIDNNSISYKYYQFDKCEVTEAMKYYVLQSIIEVYAFDELRTKQCLGYDVQFGVTKIKQHYGFYFQVTHQRNKFETQYVFNRMNEFLKQFWENFNNTDEVDKVKDALIAYKASPDECLENEFSRNKKEILLNRFKFNRLELEIEALKNITFEDVVNLKYGFIFGSTLSIEVIGNNITEDENECQPPIKKLCLEKNKNSINITNLDGFKNSLNHYSLDE